MGEYPTGTITSVQRQQRKKDRYNIFINEQYAFSVHEDVLIRMMLKKGDRIDPKQMESILRSEEEQLAYRQCLAYLGIRHRTIAEIRKYLSEKSYDDDLIELIIERLLTNGYLNDLQFATHWVEFRLRQGRGPHWIKQSLLQKGVHSSIIDTVLDNQDEIEQYERALQIAEHRWKRQTGENIAKRRKLYAYLLRRGYSNELVRKVIQQVTNESDAEHYDD